MSTSSTHFFLLPPFIWSYNSVPTLLLDLAGGLMLLFFLPLLHHLTLFFFLKLIWWCDEERGNTWWFWCATGGSDCANILIFHPALLWFFGDRSVAPLILHALFYWSGIATISSKRLCRSFHLRPFCTYRTYDTEKKNAWSWNKG